MELTGEYRIAARRDSVWRALNDPEILKKVIPGCEEIEKLSDTEFAAKLTLKLGPMQARFKGRVTLSDLDPPRSYTITGEGQGGVAGFAKGSARVTLDEESGATMLRYAASANVGGKLAQLGARLVSGTARQLADAFFGKFAGLIVDTAPAEAPPSAAPARQPEPAPEPVPPARGLPLAVWVPAVIVAMGGLLAIFGRG